MLLVMYRPVVHLFDEVRLLHHRLAQAAEELHEPTGVSAPSRAVLEYLDRNSATAVPDIARDRYVSRQHIQIIVDQLADRGLVTRAANPAHRRSPLVALTAEGATTITSMHERERALLDARLAGIDDDAVCAAAGVLAAIRSALDAGAVR
jgi:DNA-binding MarR family transcriptional regulator